MNTIISLIILGVFIMVALFLARIALAIVMVVIAGIFSGLMWVGRVLFARGK